jgi:hypothetical protein
MFYMGKELLRWAPREFGRAKSCRLHDTCALAAWNSFTLAGLLAVAGLLIGSILGGSVPLPFWELPLASRLDDPPK